MGNKYSGTPAPLATRFWRYVRPGPPDACWLWLGSIQEPGYGIIGLGGGARRGFAHRVSWEIHHGSIPKDMQVLHRCDVPACVNPDHLFLGTQADNMKDMFKKGRHTRCSTCGQFGHLASHHINWRDVAILGGDLGL